MNTSSIVKRWMQSLAAAAIANTALWIITTQLLSTPLNTNDELAIGGHQVQIPLLLLTTLVATTVGALGLAIANKALETPALPWAAVTTLAGIASLAGPASAASDSAVQLGLSAMHLTTTAVVVGAHLRPGAAEGDLSSPE